MTSAAVRGAPRARARPSAVARSRRRVLAIRRASAARSSQRPARAPARRSASRSTTRCAWRRRRARRRDRARRRRARHRPAVSGAQPVSAAAQRHGGLYQNAQVAVLRASPPRRSTPAPTHPLHADRRRTGRRRGARAGGDVPRQRRRLRSEQDELRRHEPVGARARASRRTSTPAAASRAQNDAADAQLRSANIEVVGAARAGLARRDVGVLRRGARRPTRGDRRLVGRRDRSRARADEGRAPGRQRVGVRAAARAGHARQPAARRAFRRARIGRSRICASSSCSTCRSTTRCSSRRGIEGANGPTLPAIAASVDDRHRGRRSRAPVRELDEAVRAQEAQVEIARAERIPSLVDRLELSAAVLPGERLSDARRNGVNNWTVGVSTNFPILDGGRIKGDEPIAQAGLQQARAQREQTRQFAALDTRVALDALAAKRRRRGTRAAARPIRRSARTRSIRCAIREGISTQTDLVAVAAAARAGAREPRAGGAQSRRRSRAARAACATCRSSQARAQPTRRAGAVAAAATTAAAATDTTTTSRHTNRRRHERHIQGASSHESRTQ